MADSRQPSVSVSGGAFGGGSGSAIIVLSNSNGLGITGTGPISGDVLTVPPGAATIPILQQISTGQAATMYTTSYGYQSEFTQTNIDGGVLYRFAKPKEETWIDKLKHPHIMIGFVDGEKGPRLSARGLSNGNTVIQFEIPIEKIDKNGFEDLRDDIAALAARTMDALIAHVKTRS